MAQQSERKIIHEFDIGFTSQYHLDDKYFTFFNYLREPYLFGGRRRGGFISSFIPRFSFNYNRIVDDHRFSLGFLYFASVNNTLNYVKYVSYTAVNIGYSYNNLLRSDIFSLRPKFSLQLSNGFDYSLDYSGNVINLLPQTLYLAPSFGLGINLSTYVYKKIYISKEINYVFHHSARTSFFQANVNIGYRFN